MSPVMQRRGSKCQIILHEVGVQLRHATGGLFRSRDEPVQEAVGRTVMGLAGVGTRPAVANWHRF